MPLPRISTNLAISADGKISSVTHRKSGWTSRADHQRLLDLRENADALLIGRGTLENDQMTLAAAHNPLRCIVSHSGKIDPEHPIFQKPGGAIHLLVTGDELPASLPSVVIHRTTLLHFLEILASTYQVKTVHCEGGGSLVRELAALDVIDEFHLTLAGHTIFGGRKAPTPSGSGTTDFLPASRKFEISHYEPRADLGECFLSYTRIRD